MIHILEAVFHNFRTLRDVVVPLQPMTVLVGPNNVGKTSVLQGLEFALGIGRRGYNFDERDVTTGVDQSIGFEIRLTLGPAAGTHFTAEEIHLFQNHVDVVAGEHRLFIVVAGRREEEDGVFRTRLRYAKSDGVLEGPVSATERAALGVILLGAVRDARHEFGERGGLWARLGAEADVTPEAQARLDGLGAQLGDAIVTEILGPAISTAVSDNVRGLVGSVLYGDQGTTVAGYSAVTIDPAQALRQVDVRLTTPDQSTGRRVGDHSVGTQSVAMFGLFGAYAAAMKDRVVAIGIEEPEAHLHPHATRAIVRAVLDNDAQILLTTHSPSVTDAVDPRAIVRLRRSGGETHAHAVSAGTLSERDVRAIRRVVADVGSDFLFARAVLLAEGMSERLAMPILAGSLGYDFDRLGVSVVRVEGDRFGAFAALLAPTALGIPFARLGDRDSARRMVRAAKATGVLPTAADETKPDASRAQAGAAGWFWWSAGDLETVLLDAAGPGVFVEALTDLYGAKVFERYANGAKTQVPDPIDEPAFLHAVASSRLVSKPLVAQRVAELIVENGIALPTEVGKVLTHVAELAAAEARDAVATPGEPPAAGS